jgi:hypothetical protein
MARFQWRRNTAAGAASNNAVLAAGEPGVTTDTHVLKVGDGATAWVDLAEVGSLTYARAFKAAAADTTGTTDATAILQAPITACIAAGGGLVLFDTPGTYDIRSPLVISGATNLELRGVPGVKLKLHAATARNILEIVNSTNVKISDLEFDGNQTNNTDPGSSQDADQNNILAYQVTGLEICGVNTHDAIYHGIFINNQGTNIRVSVHHCAMHHNGYRAIHAHGDNVDTASQVIVSNNYAYSNGQQAGSAGYNTGIFVGFDNMHNVIVEGNVVHDEAGAGINIWGRGSVDADRIVISGNSVYNCSKHGYWIGNGVRKFIVADNLASNCGSSGIVLVRTAAINASDPVAEWAITGNMLTGNTGYGIRLGTDGGTGLTLARGVIANNVISANTSGGIYVSNDTDVENLTVTGNVISENTGRAINFNTTGKTIRGINITGNQAKLNTGGFLALVAATRFRVDQNVSIDDTAVSAGNVTVVSLTGCSRGSVTRNHLSVADRTNAGAGIVIDATSDRVTTGRNDFYGLGGADRTNAGTYPFSEEKDWLQEIVQPAQAFTVPRLIGLNSAVAPAAGTIYLTRLRTRNKGTATGVRVAVSTTFVNATDLRIALLSDSLVTKHAETANLGNPAQTALVDCPFSATYDYAGDTWYWVAIYGVGQTAGQLRGANYVSTVFIPTIDGAPLAQAKAGYAGGDLTVPITSPTAGSFAFLAELY